MKSDTRKLTKEQRELVQEIAKLRQQYKDEDKIFTSRFVAQFVLGVSPNTLTNICTLYYVPSALKLKMYRNILKAHFELNVKVKKNKK